MTGRLRRMLAALGACAAVLVAVIAPPASTEAAFTDGERASAGLTAATMPAPEIFRVHQCDVDLLNTSIAIDWSFPTSNPARTRLSGADVVWSVGGSTPQAYQTVTLDATARTYRTTFTAGALQNVLTLQALLNLLGFPFEITGWSRLGSWTSTQERMSVTPRTLIPDSCTL